MKKRYYSFIKRCNQKENSFIPEQVTKSRFLDLVLYLSTHGKEYEIEKQVYTYDGNFTIYVLMLKNPIKEIEDDDKKGYYRDIEGFKCYINCNT